jgi:phage terminase large subunit GpA-like protein
MIAPKNQTISNNTKSVFASLVNILRPLSTESVTEWACQNIMLHEPGRTMPFSIANREFIREPLDAFNNPKIRVINFISGSQIGKTTLLLGGAGYIVKNRPSRIFWVMPTLKSYLKFYKSRLKKMEMGSPVLRQLIATPRTDLTAELQFIGSSIIEMTGANSPAGLAGSPCRVVILDEVGKFPNQTGIEADAVNLAYQRVKDFAQSLVVTTSTPVLKTSPEWQEYLKGDQRRYHIPCFFCGKMIVLSWSENLNAMPRLGCEAYVEWNQNAKTGSKWNYAIVRDSAHFVCPFCKGKITEREKRLMVPKGVWVPTNPNGDDSVRSYHIPSLYGCTSPATNVGREAVKFIKEKKAHKLQGFVNGELAEPWEFTISGKRTELVISPTVDHPGEWYKLLTADYHLNSPFIWWVVRAWDVKGNSYLCDFGSTNDFKTLDEIQKKHTIPDTQVFIDSGYNAPRVYTECLMRGQKQPYPDNGIGNKRSCENPPSFVNLGWTPVKGFTTQKNWYNDDSGKPQIYSWSEAATLTDDVALPILQLYTTPLKDILRAMRLRESEQSWAVTDIVGRRDQYWSHMDAEEIKEDKNGKYFWAKKNEKIENHLFDCEVYQVGGAVSFGLLKIENELEEEDEKKTN